MYDGGGEVRANVRTLCFVCRSCTFHAFCRPCSLGTCEGWRIRNIRRGNYIIITNSSRHQMKEVLTQHREARPPREKKHQEHKVSEARLQAPGYDHWV